ncbi:hypothetical protein [Plasmodium yoelii yoelii]|uniref:Uncharacterized protein n=1 Tax=Plasmodium yoelii yoelii TaxID=73239 RepID=Q7RLG5_PLAYO|nr:hypothetical protein [Plasmodium yoelii yoelii]
MLKQMHQILIKNIHFFLYIRCGT